ncbi:MAG TPA: sulfatase-like hydrolase/transferase [Thermoanaerobaculia bacterium]|jgi:arylsulfatase A-like enzyme/Flp pilus assembly protein TadD
MNLKRVSVPFFVLLVAFSGACRRGAEEKVAASAGAPVIVISIDTLRADHLPAYGYTAVQTPALDALRRDSILYTNAYSHAPLTLPSHVSMLTGLLPDTHKVRNNIGYRLDTNVPTIPKMLKSAGYETGAAISAYVLRGSAGLGAAFDFYDDGIVSAPNAAIGNLQRAGRDTAAIATRWIAERKDKPHFFLLHLFEPHSPYAAPEPFRSRFTLPYDAEIAAADQIVGEFLDALKRDGIYDRALIILMSDHGEGLNQHGEAEHGIFLYREAIRVPLMVKLPNGARAGETTDRAVGLVDVLPTVAEVTGTQAPAGVQGHSLLHANASSATRRIYSETLYPRIHLGWSELRSLAAADYHYIQAPRPELYDMRRDPAETKNILTDERRVYASMRDELAQFGAVTDIPTNVDPEEAKKLAALGYLGSTAAPRSGPLPDPKDGMPEMNAMMEATRFEQTGNHPEAIKRFRGIVARNPLLSDAWNLLGVSLEASGRNEEAVEAYRKVLELTPALAGEFALRLAGVYLRLSRFDEAAAHARLAETGDYSGAHLMLARIAYDQKDFAGAEREARLAMRDTQNGIAARVLIARAYAQQGRAAEALTMAREASMEADAKKIGPVESLHFVVGDALARMQQYDKAEQALRREIELFPHNRHAYASLYLVYVVTGRDAEANQALEQMVRNNPDPAAMTLAAQSTGAVGDTRASARWTQRATAARRAQSAAAGS